MNRLICPTCGCSLVRLGYAQDAISYSYDGEDYFFCCQDCVDTFAADPQKHLQETKDLIVCPTCLAEKLPEFTVTLVHDGQEIQFCRCPFCKNEFQKAPEYYLRRLEGSEAEKPVGARAPYRADSEAAAG